MDYSAVAQKLDTCRKSSAFNDVVCSVNVSSTRLNIVGKCPVFNDALWEREPLRNHLNSLKVTKQQLHFSK